MTGEIRTTRENDKTHIKEVMSIRLDYSLVPAGWLPLLHGKPKLTKSLKLIFFDIILYPLSLIVKPVSSPLLSLSLQHARGYTRTVSKRDPTCTYTEKQMRSTF